VMPARRRHPGARGMAGRSGRRARCAGAAVLAWLGAWVAAPVDAAPATLTAAPASGAVTARVEPRETTVGGRVRVELDVDLPPGTTGPPALPPGLRTWGAAEIVAAGEPQRLPGDGNWRIHLVLTAFRTGDVALPSLPIEAPAPQRDDGTPGAQPRLATPEGLGFAVRSVLPAEGQPTPLPPAPPRQLPLGEAFWWAAGSLLAAVLLAGGALAWRYQPEPAVETASAAAGLAPLPALLRELALLRAAGSPEAVHTGLSLALRRFLAGMLGFAAAERTTSEIDRELRAGPLARGTRRELVELLRRCDAVKFARRPATAADADARLDEAAALAEQVETELRPPAPAQPSADGAAA
jgi:hypothetical protein